MVGRRIFSCSAKDLDVGLTESWGESKQTSRERLILSFQVSFMMAVAINVPLGRAKKKTDKRRHGAWEPG